MRRVRRGAFAAPALSAALAGLEARDDRRFLTDLVYGTLRRLPYLDACLAPRLDAPERLPEEVRDALRVAAFELLVRNTPRHAAVHEWVEVIKRPHPRLAGLANAVLRRLEEPAGLSEAERLALPDWLHERLRRALGEDTEAAARGMLEPEPLWLAAYGDEAADRLLAEGCEVAAGPLQGTLAVRPTRPLHELSAFREGLVQPQNPASVLAARILEPARGERTLDLCSGSGVKAALLAASGARVTSVEIDARKLRRARRNLERLGLDAETTVHDLREPSGLEPAPAVLLDAPCSGTGTLRGHPEIKTRLRAADVEALAGLQARLLDTAASLTAPGGRLVYAVCALTREEGEEQLGSFLARRPDFEPEAPSIPLPSRPAGGGRVVLPVDGLDGFFLARLRRAA